jgi:hypothetical protein
LPGGTRNSPSGVVTVAPWGYLPPVQVRTFDPVGATTPHRPCRSRLSPLNDDVSGRVTPHGPRFSLCQRSENAAAGRRGPGDRQVAT